MAYKFDKDLVTNVLKNDLFIRTGAYPGSSGKYHYAVVDGCSGG